MITGYLQLAEESVRQCRPDPEQAIKDANIFITNANAMLERLRTIFDSSIPVRFGPDSEPAFASAVGHVLIQIWSKEREIERWQARINEGSDA